MASENADLVDINFCLQYLLGASKAENIDRKKVETFVDIFRSKASDAATISFLKDQLNTNSMLIDVVKSFDLKEYDDIILQKWMHGNRCSTDFTQMFDHCREVIESRGDDWSAD